MWFKSTGRLRYNPVVRDLPLGENWLILDCDQNILKYYQYWLKKNAYVFDRPAWGSHISVIRGESISTNYKDKWGFNNGSLFSFEYEVEYKTNGDYIWFEVRSEELLDLREIFGLRREPKYNLHLSIAKLKPENWKKF